LQNPSVLQQPNVGNADKAADCFVRYLINPYADNGYPNNFCLHQFINQLVNIEIKMLEDSKAFY